MTIPTNTAMDRYIAENGANFEEKTRPMNAAKRNNGAHFNMNSVRLFSVVASINKDAERGVDAAGDNHVKRQVVDDKRADSARVQRFVMSRPSVTRRTIQPGPERATTQPYFQVARYLSRAMAATATTSSNIARSLFFKKRRGITAELTRRREFIQASPDQS